MAIPPPIRVKLKFKKKDIIVIIVSGGVPSTNYVVMKLRKSRLIRLEAFVIHLRDFCCIHLHHVCVTNLRDCEVIYLRDLRMQRVV